MGDRGDEAAISQASAIAMDRYELSRPKAQALVSRLARASNVTVPVMAAAIIAAALARRRRDEV